MSASEDGQLIKAKDTYYDGAVHNLYPLISSALTKGKDTNNTYRGIVPTLAREIKALLNVKNGSGKEDRNGAPRKDCR